MDLDFTPREEEFRRIARAWLEANVPAAPLLSMDTAEGFEQHRVWERQLYEGGWSAVSWPVEYGGRGANLIEWLIFEEEYYRAGAPGRVNQNGIFLLGPTIIQLGTDEQKARILPAMASGDEIWCQGWSEPDAGSDLAAIRSRAVRHGDDYVLDGQKTWCSRGAFADWMFGLFRTDPSAERHRGLTFILVPMHAEGVTVRPIAQLDGDPGFAEVFLDGVRVPASNVVGDEDRGWAVAMATAGFERGLSLRSPARYSETARRLVELYGRVASSAEPAVGDEVVRGWMDAEAYRLHTYWTVSRIIDGGTIGAEASLNKLWWSEMDLRLHELALRLLGPAGELLADAPDSVDDGRWLDGFLFALAGPIYAGTNEIQRNVVADRVLSLPRST
ncbi:MAG TPA: acyl-CoA dehydrogenase family protein [Acidimicrobiales bacterium]|nr:acyl-CoA dehydrogenase family protein [Acidimicrobiales bacterium]